MLNLKNKVPGFTMPSSTITTSDSNPNKNPTDNFKPISDFTCKHTSRTSSTNNPVYCLFDHSGSNARCASLMKNIANTINYTNTQVTIIPFGSNINSDYRQFPAANYWPTQQNCNLSTHTNFIQKFFDIITHQTTPYTLVFLGDGEFSASQPSHTFQYIIERAALNGTLDRCKQLTILFSPHTYKITIDTLVTELTQICARTRNIIPIQCHLLITEHGNNSQLNVDDSRIIHSIGNVVGINLPPKFIRVGDWAIHEQLNMQSLINILKNNALAANDIITLIQQNASINPSLLISHQMYGLLYRVLCHQTLFGKQMHEWMNNMITNKNTPTSHRQTLQTLLDMSRAAAAKDSLISLFINLQEHNLIIGFQKSADNAINPTDIRTAIKDMNFKNIINLAQTLIKSAQHNLIQPKHTTPGQVLGIPILNAKKATHTECLEALKLMFCQFGEDLFVNGIMLYIATLSMLFTDTQVNKTLFTQIEHALFDNLLTTLTNIGITKNTTTEVWEWDADIHSRICTPAVCGLLARAFTHFGDRLFPGVDFINPRDEHKMAVTAYNDILGTARAYTIDKFLNNISIKNSDQLTKPDPIFAVHNEFVFSIFTDNKKVLDTNIIYTFKPFNNDPQPNIPRLCVSTTIIGKSRCQLEYLDRPLGTGDIITMKACNLIPLYNLSGMSSIERNHIITQFNEWFHKMQQDGACGLLGPQMGMDIPPHTIQIDNDLYDSNMRTALDKFYELIAQFYDHPQLFQLAGYKSITRPLLRKEALDIITDMAAFTPDAIQIYMCGNNLNSSDLVVCKNRLPGQQPITPPGLSNELILNVRNAFTRAMIPTQLAHLQISTVNTCCCCLDTLANRHMVKLACTHNLCNTCYNTMINYQAIPSELINMAMCRCPICKTILPLNDKLLLTTIQTTTTIHTADNTVILRCRIPECTTPYYIDVLTCDTTPDTLPKLCTQHRPKDENIKVIICPNLTCGASITRISGCDVVKCQCQQKLCFGCGAALPSLTSHWSCHGSYDACNNAVIQIPP